MFIRNRIVFAAEGAAAGAAPAAAAAAPAAAPLAFADTLPEDIRGDAVFKDIKDLGGLAKGYLNAQKMIGHPPERVLALPTGDDAKDWAAVWDKLGRPAAPDKYELPPPAAGAPVDPKFREAFLARAHENGLNGKQARGLYDWYSSEAATAATAATTASAARQAQATDALRTEWGAAFEQNLEAARTALKHYGGDELTSYLNESKLGDDPRLIKVFAKLGKQLGEDGLVGRGGASAAFSPTEAQQQIAALQQDKTFTAAYQDKRNPGHADAVMRMEGLYKSAYPG